MKFVRRTSGFVRRGLRTKPDKAPDTQPRPLAQGVLKAFSTMQHRQLPADFDDQSPTVQIPAFVLASENTRRVARAPTVLNEYARGKSAMRTVGWTTFFLMVLVVGRVLWDQAGAYAQRTRPAQLPAASAPAPAAPAKKTPIAPAIKLEAERPFPTAATEAIAKGRFTTALEALPKDAPKAWKQKIRTAWLGRIAKARSADKQLDALSALLSVWPNDSKAKRLAAKARARHRSAIERLERKLSGAGVTTKVQLSSAKRRTYNIHIQWKPSKEAEAAFVADPQQAGMDLLGRFIGVVASSTKRCGFRTNEARFQLVGGTIGWALSTRCARQLATEKNTARFAKLWKRCVRTMRY